MRRTVMIVNSHSTLAQLRRDDFPARVLKHDVSGLSYTMRLFLVVCATITAELITFAAEADDEINFMVGGPRCSNNRDA